MATSGALWCAVLLTTSFTSTLADENYTLAEVANTIQGWWKNPPGGKISLRVIGWTYMLYTRYRQPENYPDLSSENLDLAYKISMDAADIITNLSLTSFKGSYEVEGYTLIIVKELVSGRNEDGFRDNFRGEPIYLENGFNVSAMCLVSKNTHAGFIIYPPSTTVMRGLPDIGVPITRYHSLDLVLIRLEDTSEVGDDTTCSDYEYMDMLVMERHSDLAEPNLRFGCAQWDESERKWRSEDCYVVQDLWSPMKATCYCDTNQNARSVQFIMFEYFEDVGLGSRYGEVEAKPYNAGDLFELKECESQIIKMVGNPNLTDTYEVLINRDLPKLLQFIPDVTSTENVMGILDKIGDVLTKVVPDKGADLIGRGNQYVSSFVFVMEYYRTNPVAGYAFYQNTSMWTEYFRMAEVTDWNRLFHEGKSYSFMFSDGVLEQNIRYGFILFPRDKYLTPITSIAGRNVVAFRVIDVTLVKLHDLRDRREQLINMYLNAPDGDERPQYGCAYWSNRNATWETAHCKMNLTVYRDVCTCNMTTSFNESRSRVQFVTYSYRHPDLDVVGEEASSDYKDFEFMSTSLFALQELQRYPYGDRTIGKALKLMESVFHRPNVTQKLNEETKRKAVDDARKLLAVNDCRPQQIRAAADSFGALCYNSYNPTAVAMAFNRAYRYYETISFTKEDFNETKLITDKTVFAVHMSDSTAEQNMRYGVLVFPNDVTIHPVPRIGRKIIRSRVVEVVLVANKAPVRGDQKIELYLDQTEYNATQGCAYWTEDWKSWTESGCRSREVNGLTACECSMSIHFLETRNGGQYLVFTYSDVFFDQKVYEKLTTLETSNVFDQAAALIHNASMIPLDDELLIKVLRVYMQLLSLPATTLTERSRDIDVLLDDLELMFSRYRVEPWHQVCHSFGIASTWDVQSADVVKDLFSNAILSAPSSSGTEVSSYMLVTVFGYYKPGKDGATGLYFSRGPREGVHFTHGNDNSVALESRPSFACSFIHEDTLRFFRVVLTVYPLNMSPLPKTMTEQPIFNSRQLDVYMDLQNDLKALNKVPPSPPSSAQIEIYFQPTTNPKSYVVIGCAAWVNGKWTADLCELIAIGCRCEVIKHAVTRIIAYEYTNLPNFNTVEKLEPKNIIFLVGASLSLFGLAAITVTAILFRPWREDVGNQILMHLAASSCLYLSLSIYRETHVIYSAKNYTSIALIIFSVAVHYSRLTHYCWGLAISILQYLRFSSELGANAKSFLVTKMAVLSWGAPLIPLIVLLAWDTSEHFCNPSTLTHLVVYLIPGAAITLLSIGFLAAIVNKIVKTTETPGDDLTTQLKTVVLMFFLFGIPTVFEMFNDIWGHSEVVEYIYKVLDPIQGFVLFLFFIVVDDKSRGYWMAKFCGGKAEEGTQIEMTDLKGTTKQES